MALSVTGTGPYAVNSSLGGAQAQHAEATYNYFSGNVTCNSTYGTNDDTILDFGSVMSEIVIINYGTYELVFQWKEGWGTDVDHGIVLPNSLGLNQVTLRRVHKSGLKVRCGQSGQTTQALVWAI